MKKMYAIDNEWLEKKEKKGKRKKKEKKRKKKKKIEKKKKTKEKRVNKRKKYEWSFAALPIMIVAFNFFNLNALAL